MEQNIESDLVVENHAKIKPLLEEWTIKYRVDEIVDSMLQAGVPCSPINTVDRLVVDPHIAEAREMFVDVEHPKAGAMKLTGSHIKFTSTPSNIRTPAPHLGEHNQEVFGSLLGIAGESINELKRGGYLIRMNKDEFKFSFSTADSF